MLLNALQFVLKHRRACWLVVLAVVLVGGIAMLCGHYGTRIEGVFPKGSASARAMALLEESGLSNRLTIDCDATSCPNGLDEVAVTQLDDIVNQLAGLAGVSHVQFRTFPQDLSGDLENLLPVLPQFVQPPEVTSERMNDIAHNSLKQLMMPTPGATVFLRSDPFGLRGSLLMRLQTLRQVSGVEFDDSKPFLCSKDGLHALIVLELSIPYSDSAATRELLTQIHKILDTTNPKNHSSDFRPFTYHLIGAHLHTIGNEDTIRRDLTLIGILSPLFLVALFFMVFRGDWRCIWIPLIPTGATIVIAGLLSTLGGPLQLFVLGLGGSILGLAVDQGIHVYIACQESAPLQRLSRLAKPLALGAGTSIVAFFLLIFTRSPALQQLGVLASGALALSLVAFFFLLPTLLPASRGKRLQPKPPKVPKLKSLSPKIALILVLGLTALSFLPRLTTSFRIESLDGIPEKVREDENAFAATWQPVAPNLLLLRDPNVTQTPQLQTALTDCQPLTALDFWPAEEARKKNLDAWKNAPLDEWERQLAEAAKTCGLPYEFYKPFFEGIRLGLAEPPSRPPDWFQQARQRLCHNGIMIFFLAKPDGAQDILNHSSFDAALLTPEALRATLTRDFGSHLIWIITAATAVIILLTLVSLHSLKKVLFALLPVFLTLRWLSAGFALVGHPITLMTAIGSVLLIGLSIDYGVFAVQWLDDGSNSSIPHAMLLSAITTVFTTGILLFSKHPVLFDLGIVLSFGITLSYLIARFLVPALAHLSFRNSSALLFVLTFSALLSGCQNIYPSRPGLTSETARSELQVLHQTQSVNTRSIQAKVTARFFWHHIPFIVVGQLNEETRELRVAGLAPTGGAKLFQITATPSEILSSEISPMAPAIARRAFERIAKDLACAFLDNLPEIPASISPDSRGVIHFAVNGLNYTFAGEPLRLYRKASQKPRWAWKRDPANPQIWLFRDPNAHLCLEVTFLP